MRLQKILFLVGHGTAAGFIPPRTEVVKEIGKYGRCLVRAGQPLKSPKREERLRPLSRSTEHCSFIPNPTRPMRFGRFQLQADKSLCFSKVFNTDTGR